MEEKPALSPPVVAGIVAVVAVGGFFIAKAFMPQAETTAASVNAMASNPDTKYLMDMAKKCQGDFSKLSPEDQQAVLAKTGNNRFYAQTYIKRMYVPGK